MLFKDSFSLSSIDPANEDCTPFNCWKIIDLCWSKSCLANSRVLSWGWLFFISTGGPLVIPFWSSVFLSEDPPNKLLSPDSPIIWDKNSNTCLNLPKILSIRDPFSSFGVPSAFSSSWSSTSPIKVVLLLLSKCSS